MWSILCLMSVVTFNKKDYFACEAAILAASLPLSDNLLFSYLILVLGIFIVLFLNCTNYLLSGRGYVLG
jgi:hypothetical protein